MAPVSSEAGFKRSGLPAEALSLRPPEGSLSLRALVRTVSLTLLGQLVGLNVRMLLSQVFGGYTFDSYRQCTFYAIDIRNKVYSRYLGIALA